MHRLSIATVLVLAVAALLWLSSPAGETAEGYNYQGLAHIEIGEYHEAIVALTKAIELDPELAIAYNNRGWAYIELGQY